MSMGKVYAALVAHSESLMNLHINANADEFEQNVLDYLFAFPEERRSLIDGQRDFTPQVSAARAYDLFMKQHPDSEDGPPNFNFADTFALVRGHYEPDTLTNSHPAMIGVSSEFGRLRLSDGGYLRVSVRRGAIEPRRDSWCLVNVGVSDDGAPFGGLRYSTPSDGALWIPSYGLGLVGDFARSQLSLAIVAFLDLAAQTQDADHIRAALFFAHSGDPIQVEQVVTNRSAWHDELQFSYGLGKYADTPDHEPLDLQPPSLPAPRLVRTFREAEQYAAEVMEHLGFTNVVLSGRGADGGIDVRCAEAVVQVKMEALAVGRPVIQAIFGIASMENRHAAVFSLSGYTKQAVEWADKAGVALLAFAFDGSLEPANDAASGLLRHGVNALPTISD